LSKSLSSYGKLVTRSSWLHNSVPSGLVSPVSAWISKLNDHCICHLDSKDKEKIHQASADSVSLKNIFKLQFSIYFHFSGENAVASKAQVKVPDIISQSTSMFAGFWLKHKITSPAPVK
jgi:hypothetical protein